MKKFSKGQSLLEFALVAPILVLILVVISELGYTFVVRHTIIDGIKQTVLSSHSLIGKYSTTQELLDAMKANMNTYVSTHNLPTPVKLDFGVGTSNAYGTAVIIPYTYKPAFRLIGITPEQVTIQSSQVLQSGLLKINAPTVPSVAI
ncbi:MAG: TadE family protein [Vampirovibrionia bacterium]